MTRTCFTCKQNLSTSTISSLKSWHKFQKHSSFSGNCFCLRCSNAPLERSFSQMKRIKTTGQCSLVSERLENLVRLGEEGVEWCGICKNKKTQSVQGNKNNIPNSSSSDESEFEGFGEKDFDKESDILLNKKTID